MNLKSLANPSVYTSLTTAVLAFGIDRVAAMVLDGATVDRVPWVADGAAV